ncbi:MAG: hypothetical protein KGL42_16525 [Betaproteobacteria bacterium]|nr:hypothetical protein [Betaproteobacteria bacterium]
MNHTLLHRNRKRPALRCMCESLTEAARRRPGIAAAQIAIPMNALTTTTDAVRKSTYGRASSIQRPGSRAEHLKAWARRMCNGSGLAPFAARMTATTADATRMQAASSGLYDLIGERHDTSGQTRVGGLRVFVTLRTQPAQGCAVAPYLQHAPCRRLCTRHQSVAAAPRGQTRYLIDKLGLSAP